MVAHSYRKLNLLNKTKPNLGINSSVFHIKTQKWLAWLEYIWVISTIIINYIYIIYYNKYYNKFIMKLLMNYVNNFPPLKYEGMIKSNLAGYFFFIELVFAAPCLISGYLWFFRLFKIYSNHCCKSRNYRK